MPDLPEEGSFFIIYHYCTILHTRLPQPQIEDLTLMVISYEIYETSLWHFHKFHMK